MTAGGLEISDADTTLIKDGEGKLSLTSGDNAIDSSSTIPVSAGELSMQSDGSDPLDGATVVFDDSANRDATPTLTITGADIGPPTGLQVDEGYDYTADTNLDGLGTSGNGWVDDWGTTHSDTYVLNASSVTGSQNTWDGVFTSVVRTGIWAGNNFTDETSNGHQ